MVENRPATPPTVKEALQRFVDEHLSDTPRAFDAVMKQKRLAWFRDLPERYRRLAEEVVMRLPDGWDSHCDWEIVAGEIREEVDDFYAGARRVDPGDTDSGFQQWIVTLCPSLDSAARGISDCNYELNPANYSGQPDDPIPE